MITIAFCCLSEAMFQTHHRGLQSWIQVIAVVAFVLVMPVHVFANTCMIVVSLWRITTGTVGGWAVTTRVNDEVSAKAHTPGTARAIKGEGKWTPSETHRRLSSDT